MKLFVWLCPGCGNRTVYPHGSEFLMFPNHPKRNRVDCWNECCGRKHLPFEAVFVPEGSER